MRNVWISGELKLEGDINVAYKQVILKFKRWKEVNEAASTDEVDYRKEEKSRKEEKLLFHLTETGAKREQGWWGRGWREGGVGRAWDRWQEGRGDRNSLYWDVLSAADRMNGTFRYRKTRRRVRGVRTETRISSDSSDINKVTVTGQSIFYFPFDTELITAHSLLLCFKCAANA